MSLVVKIGANMKDFDRKLKKATKDISYFGKKLSNTGKSLTTKVTLPIVGISAAALKVGSDFEAGMSKVSAITGATGEDFEKLKNQAKELGASTKFSANEAAEAMTYLGMAGMSTEQIMAAMPGMLDLAAASGTDLATTADIVSDALTAFGMSAEESGHLADVMARASSTANTNVEMLGESFKYAAPVATAFGMSAEETTAALAVMANSGIKASKAGTALRGALTRLTDPSKEASGMMKQLGISISDTEGNMLPFNDIMNQLRDSTKKLSSEQQMQAISTIFGKEAMSGMMAVLNTSTEGFANYTNELINSDGAAKTMAETMQDNLQGTLTKLKSALEGIGIQIAETLIPIVEKMVEKINEWVTRFGNLSDSTKEMIVKIAMIASAIGPLLLVIGKTITTVGKLKATWGLLGKALEGVALGPIVAVIAGIVALIAIFGHLYKTNEDFRNKVQEIWEQIRVFFSTAIEAIKLLITSLCNLLTTAWESNFLNIQGIVQSGWDFITQIFTSAIEILTGIFRVFIDLLQGNWSGALENIKKLLETVIGSIKNIISTGLDFILNLFGTSLDKLKTNIDKKIEAIKNIFYGLRNAVNNVVSGIVNAFKNIRLPKFSLKWSSKTFFGKEIKYPTGFNINWHEDGGIFTKPTILGGHGFGEAGKEAILPLSKLPGLLGLSNGSNIIQVILDGKVIQEYTDNKLGSRVSTMAGV